MKSFKRLIALSALFLSAACGVQAVDLSQYEFRLTIGNVPYYADADTNSKRVVWHTFDKADSVYLYKGQGIFTSIVTKSGYSVYKNFSRKLEAETYIDVSEGTAKLDRSLIIETSSELEGFGTQADSICIRSVMLSYSDAAFGESGTNTLTFYYIKNLLTCSLSDSSLISMTVACGGTEIANNSDLTAYDGKTLTVTLKSKNGVQNLILKHGGNVVASETAESISYEIAYSGGIVTLDGSVLSCQTITPMAVSGGGVRCATSGKAYLKLNVLHDLSYRIFRNGTQYGSDYASDSTENQKIFEVSDDGEYTMLAYQTGLESSCGTTAMSGSATVSSVTSDDIDGLITQNFPVSIKLYPYQRRVFLSNAYDMSWSSTGGTTLIEVANTPSTYAVKYSAAGNYTVTANMLDANGEVTQCSATRSFEIIDASAEQCIE